MKNVILLCLIAVLTANVQLNAQKAVFTSYTAEEVSITEVNPVAIQWDKQEHDYGNIPQGIPASSDFVLTNNGTESLVITNVKGSCGCTATQHDKEPVLPGESTTITATYNAKKQGIFTKTIKVSTTANDEPIVLKIKGKVVK